MTTKHTPGPWQCNDGVTIAAQSPHGPAYTVAKVAFERPRDEFFANARLIAAAPELLEACEALLAQHDESFAGREDMRAQYYAKHPWREQAYNKARAAIAAAKGTTP